MSLWPDWRALELPSTAAARSVPPLDIDPAIRSSKDCFLIRRFVAKTERHRALRGNDAAGSTPPHKKRLPWLVRILGRVCRILRRRVLPASRRHRRGSVEGRFPLHQDRTTRNVSSFLMLRMFDEDLKKLRELRYIDRADNTDKHDCNSPASKDGSSRSPGSSGCSACTYP